MDSGLESRIKKSHKKLSKYLIKLNKANYDLTKKTEKGLLTLRKNQIDDYIMSKRKIILNENLGYQINPLNLVIGDEYVMDIEMFLKNVKQSPLILV